MKYTIKDAKWITCGPECDAPVFRKPFFLTKPISGEIDITGLGYFELYVNGKRISDDHLVPVISDYQKRTFTNLTYPISDTFTHRIYYLHYDLSDVLKDGENILEVILGNGLYKQIERIAEGTLSYDISLKTCFTASFVCENQEIIKIFSDGSETWTPSFITFNNLFIGEIQDARLLGIPKEEKVVQILPAPDAELNLQTCPPDRIIRTLKPTLLSDDGNRKIYDTGENVSGWVQVKATGNSGDVITLLFAENLDDNGQLNYSSTGGNHTCSSGKKQVMTDTFICDGRPRVFEPKFSFHAFRYFEVTGKPEDLTVAVVHSDEPCTSTFNSDSEGLNWLYDAYIRTQLNNMHSGVPSDCPHRERLGYTGDGQITCDAAMLLLDSRAFYEKWIRDILDCQDVEGGHVQHTAPFMGGGGGPGGWGCAIVIVPFQYYSHFGDYEMLRKCYPHMKKWIAYLKRHTEDFLVTHEEVGGWCLGDWCTLDKTAIPEAFVNTYYYIKSLEILSQIAKLLGESNDVPDFINEAALSKNSLIRHYFNPETGSFCEGIQGADAYAIDIGISEVRTLDNLVNKYEALGYFDTGFIGTDILTDVLFRYRHPDTAFRLITSEIIGSYLWMKRHGATTIWEDWKGRSSHDHPMFGGPVRQLFTALLGIKQDNASTSYSKIVISPSLPEGLNHISGKIATHCGEIRVSWLKNGNHVTLEAEIPDGINAEFLYDTQFRILSTGKNTICFCI